MSTELGLTPSQTVGPYLSIGLLGGLTTPNLVDPGDPRAVRVHGTLLDGAGEAVPDGMIEIWQANAEGRYAHSSDDREEIPLEPGFRGFGPGLGPRLGPKVPRGLRASIGPTGRGRPGPRVRSRLGEVGLGFVDLARQAVHLDVLVRRDLVPQGLHDLLLRELLDLDMGLKPGRVRRARIRRVHQIDAALAAQLEVSFERARIAREVFARSELERVDEDARDDVRRRAARPFDQREVPCVDRAHGRHERDALAPAPPRCVGPRDTFASMRTPSM